MRVFYANDRVIAASFWVLAALPTALEAMASDALRQRSKQGAALVEGKSTLPDAATPGVTSYAPEFFAASRPSTALDMVTLVPGFTIQGGILARGLEGTETNVLIDGSQVPRKGESIYTVLGRIPASSVVSVQRILSGTPSTDTAGFPEVLNVIRFPRSETGGTLTLSAGESGQIDARSGSFTGTHGRPGRVFSGAVNVSGTESGSHSSLVPDGQAAQDEVTRNHLDSSGGSGSADLRFPKNFAWRSDASYSENASRSTQNRSVGGLQTLDLTSQYDSSSRKVSTRLEHTQDAGLSAALEAVRSDTDSDSSSNAVTPTGSSSFASHNRSTETALALTMRSPTRGPWRREVSVDFAVNEVASSSEYATDGTPVPLPLSNILVTENRIGGSLRLGWIPAGQWAYNAKLRGNFARLAGERALDDSRSITEIKPELDARGQLGKHYKLDIRLAREIDQLAFSAFTASAALADSVVTIGNPEIDPIRRWVIEATLRRTLVEQGEASLTANLARIDNPTEFVLSPSGYDALNNISPATEGHLDAQLALPLDFADLSGARIDLGLSYGFSRVKDPTTGELRSRSNDTQLTWTASIRQDIKRIPFSYGVSAADSRGRPSIRPTQIDRYETALSLSGFAEYHFRSNLALNTQVSWSGPTRYEREVYSGNHSSGTLIERQIQHYPDLTSVYLTLRLEL